MLRLLLLTNLFTLLSAQNCQVTPLLPWTPPPIRDSETLATRVGTAFSPVPAPNGVIYFADSYSRLRRLDPNGTITTLHRFPHPRFITKLDRNGILHVAIDGQILQRNGAEFTPIAGSGHPGFNAESGPALEVNLGAIRDFAFDRSNTLHILDAFSRLRVLESTGELRTIAGSNSRSSESGIPALSANLRTPAEIWFHADGTIILAGSGRIDPAGIFRTNTGLPIPRFAMPDGTLLVEIAPSALVPYDTPTVDKAVFSGYTGTPVAVTPEGDLLLSQVSPTERRLARFKNGVHTTIAAFPTPPGFFRPPTVLWDPTSQTTYYSTEAGVSRIQPTGAVLPIALDPDSPIALGPGNSIFAVKDRALVQVDANGVIRPVNTRNGPLPFTNFSRPPLARQSIAWSADGYLYWLANEGTINVWQASSETTATITADDARFLIALPDGSVAAWFAPAFIQNPPRLRRLVSASIGAELNNYPLTEISTASANFFVSRNSRLFHVTPSGTRLLTLAELNLPAPPTIASVSAIPGGVILAISAYNAIVPFRIDNIDTCESIPVPEIPANAIVNAANYLYAGAIGPGSLLAVFGKNLASPSAKAGLRDRFGAITSATEDVPDFGLPVLYATPAQMLIQGPPISSAFNWTWQGLTWFYPTRLIFQAATPALFTASATGAGPAAALNQDGSVNSASNPALPGTVVQFFGTGFGAVSEPVLPGELFSPATLSPLSNSASLRIGGQPAELLYAGGAPGQLSGIYQLNATIPLSTASGPQAVVLTVAGQQALSSAPVTIHVR